MAMTSEHGDQTLDLLDYKVNFSEVKQRYGGDDITMQISPISLRWTVPVLFMWAVLPSVSAPITAADDLPKILAQVNNTSIMKQEVLGGLAPQQPVRPALDRAVDRALAAQQARRERLDRDPEYKRVLGSQQKRAIAAARTRDRFLVQFLQDTDTALAAARQSATEVADADVDAFIAANPERVRGDGDDPRPAHARNLLIGDRLTAAYGDWVKPLLADAEFTLNGTPLPRADIEAAIVEEGLWLFAMPQEQTSGLAARIMDRLKAQSENDEDAEALLAAAVVGVNGETFTLGELGGFREIVAAASGGASQALLLQVLVNPVLAGEATRRGLDQDPDYVRMYGGLGDRQPEADDALADLYFSRHGLTLRNVIVDGEQLAACHAAVVEALLDGGSSGFRSYVDSLKQAHVQKPLRDDEFKAWKSAITQEIMGGGRYLSSFIQRATLEWKRAAHIEPLRANAKIKYYIE